jgi:hypothetical protein
MPLVHLATNAAPSKSGTKASFPSLAAFESGCIEQLHAAPEPTIERRLTTSLYNEIAATHDEFASRIRQRSGLGSLEIRLRQCKEERLLVIQGASRTA